MNFCQFIHQFTGLVGPIIVLLSSVALVVFLAGVVRFLFTDTDNSKGREEGKRLLGWGIVALFVLFSLFGILQFFSKNVFGQSLPGATSSFSC